MATGLEQREDYAFLATWCENTHTRSPANRFPLQTPSVMFIWTATAKEKNKVTTLSQKCSVPPQCLYQTLCDVSIRNAKNNEPVTPCTGMTRFLSRFPPTLVRLCVRDLSCHSGFRGPHCDIKEYNVLYVVPGSGKLHYVLIASIIGALQVVIICVVVLCITRWVMLEHTRTHTYTKTAY